MPDLGDALDGMTRRQLEDLVSQATRRLASCLLCGETGAVGVACSLKKGDRGTRFTLLMCPACIEKHRLPESRAEA